MRHRIRLGPAAVFLTVMVMVMTVLALLTVSTSSADLAMAQRFASVTQTRYALEADGQEFLADAAAAAAGGEDISKIDGVTAKNGSYLFEKESDGYRLQIEISQPDSSGSFELLSHRLSRIWDPDDPVKDIWQGD